MSTVRDEFAVHMLNEAGKVRARAIAEAFSDLLNKLEAEGIAASREFSLCKTKLEEASFFAKRAMASQPANQEGYEAKGLANPQSPPFNGFNRV